MEGLYEHPDGMGAIQFDIENRRLFMFTPAEGLSAYAVIGPTGLRVLACTLLAMADEVEAKQ